MKTYTLVVDNIGTIFTDCNNLVTAKIAFYLYVNQSKANYGRASGESVTLLQNETNDIVLEYIGSLYKLEA